MDSPRSQVGDNMEKPLAGENNTNIGLIIKALKEDPVLKLYIQDRRTPNSGRPTGDGLLKLGQGDTLQAEFGPNSVAVTEHPGQFTLTETSIVSYREHVRQRAIKAAADPYVPSPPVRKKPAPAKTKQPEVNNHAVEIARRQLAAELEKIFDKMPSILISRGMLFSLLLNFDPVLVAWLREAKFAKTAAGPEVIRASGTDVRNFLNPICQQKRFNNLFGNGQFYINTILINSADRTVIIRETN